jgi:hypothetical protein
MKSEGREQYSRSDALASGTSIFSLVPSCLNAPFVHLGSHTVSDADSQTRQPFMPQGSLLLCSHKTLPVWL